MNRQSALLIILMLFLVSISYVTLTVHKAEAAVTIYIRADGSIDPPTAPISTADNVTYTLTGNITSYYADGIVVERDNIVVDGAEWVLQGTTREYYGIDLSGRTNVTIENARIATFYLGIKLNNSSGNDISGNNITNTEIGIDLLSSSNNNVSGNDIIGNYQIGIRIYDFGNNSFSGNNIESNYYGIYLQDSSNNTFSGNRLASNEYGVELTAPYQISANNSLSGNSFISDGLYVTDLNSCPNIASDNLVNGKSLAYLDGISDLIVGEAGQVVIKDCSNITIRNLNLSDTAVGIHLLQSNCTTIANNTIENNQIGVLLFSSADNTIRENNITANNAFDIKLYNSYDNKLYHNNLGNNVYLYDSGNVWDDGYPSGGNYWGSSYWTIDYKSGPSQDQSGSDGIGDYAKGMDENNTDNYPLMSPWLPPPEHGLVVSIDAPVCVQAGSSESVYATVANHGSNDEVNIGFSLLIDGSSVNSTTIPILEAGGSYTLSHFWTPTVQGTCNLTAYATLVPGEASVENNQESAFVRIVQIGFKAGDWAKYTYTLSGWPSETPYPEWLKVEFLSIDGTNVTLRVTMHMSDGTEQNATVPVDVVTGGQTFVTGGQAFGISGLVVPANSTTGDTVYISGYGNVTVAGETTRSYLGTSRTVVYASFSQVGAQLTYYWDKQTGVIVEASTTSGAMTGIGKVTETNMWQAAPGFPIDPAILAALIAVVAVAIITAFLFIRRRKKPAETVKSETGKVE